MSYSFAPITEPGWLNFLLILSSVDCSWINLFLGCTWN